MTLDDGRTYNHWLDESLAEYSLVHIYQDPVSKFAVRVTEDTVVAGEPIPTMTYELKNLVAETPTPSTFELINGYTHGTCTRHLTGFPYLHAFHWYLRF